MTFQYPIIIPALLLTDLGPGFPALDLVFQYLLLRLQHATFFTQFRVGLLQWQNVRFQLLQLKQTEYVKKDLELIRSGTLKK